MGLRVTDPDGASDDATVFVNVSNLPPVATIVTPAEDPGPSWRVGDTISFSGTGFDPDDGVLAPDTPGQEWLWEVILHHCPIECHTHPELTLTGVSSGSFVSPDHEYPSYLEIRLTVYDSTLTAHSHSVDIRLDTATPSRSQDRPKKRTKART